MANEVIFTSLGDQTTAAILNDFALELFEAPDGLEAHPAIVDCGMVNATATDTIKVPGEYLNGYDRMAAVGTETDSTSNTAITDAAFSLVIAPYTLKRTMGDFARLTSKYDRMQRYALDMVQSDIQTEWYLLTQLVDGFSNVTGTAGAPMTWETFLDAHTQLDVNGAPEERLCLLHPFQWGQLRKDSAFGSGGAWQWSKAADDTMLKMGVGYKGRIANTAIYTHNAVSLSSSNRLGALWARNAVLRGRGTPPVDSDIGDILLANRVKVRKQGIEGTITTGILGSAYKGYVIGQDVRGTVIRSASA